MQWLHLYFAGEYIPIIAQRRSGLLWVLYPVKQYGPAGFLDGVGHLPWYLQQVATDSRDFIDLRVPLLWLTVVLIIDLVALRLRSGRLPIRLLWLGLVAGSIPVASSVLGGGGFSISALLFLGCACESGIGWLFVHRSRTHSAFNT